MEERHIALPKLYGAPAYTRPRPPVEEAPKPFDPDELPIAAFRTDEEQKFVQALPPKAFAPGGGVVLGSDDDRDGRREEAPRPRGLRGLAGRLLGGN